VRHYMLKSRILGLLRQAKVLLTLGMLTGTAAALAAAPTIRGPSLSFFEPFDRIDSRRWYTSDGWVNGNHQGCTWSRDNVRVKNGVLQLSINKSPNRLRDPKCAEIRTNVRLGYGLYEARKRAASGTGLNTAMFTYSSPPLTDVRDEMDIEILGKSPELVQFNYFVSARGGHESLNALGTEASAGFNHYAIEWLPKAVKWYVNGRLVRTVAGGKMPSVSDQLLLSLWSGSPDLEAWLGKFQDPHCAVTAQVDWVAYTRLGEECHFPESVSCKIAL